MKNLRTILRQQWGGVVAISIMLRDGSYDSVTFVANTIKLENKSDFYRLVCRITLNMFSIKDKNNIIVWENDSAIHNRFRASFSRTILKSYLDSIQYFEHPDFIFDIQDIFRWNIRGKAKGDRGYSHLADVVFEENKELIDEGIKIHFDEGGLLYWNTSQ